MKFFKKQIREHFLEVRMGIGSERRAEAALSLQNQSEKFLQDAPFVLSFASFGNEINLWPLNQKLAQEKRLLLPFRNGDRLEIYHVQNLPDTSCKKLWEPIPNPALRISPEKISLILVPGICFDLRGHRLGYGKGYYDRLLAELKSAKTFGIGFEEQLSKEDLPVESWDLPVNKLLLF